MAASPPKPVRPKPVRPKPVDPKPARAKRMTAADRRAMLLAHAVELLEQGGSDALRMDALARASGVTRPVVYEHFGGREGLLVALVQEHGARLQARVRASVGATDSLEDELRAGVRAYLKSVREQGAALRGLLRSTGVSPAVEQARNVIWESATARWAARYRQEVDLSRSDAEALAAFHLHGLWSLSDRWLAGKLSARRVEELHLSIAISSLHEVGRPRSTS